MPASVSRDIERVSNCPTLSTLETPAELFPGRVFCASPRKAAYQVQISFLNALNILEHVHLNCNPCGPSSRRYERELRRYNADNKKELTSSDSTATYAMLDVEGTVKARFGNCRQKPKALLELCHQTIPFYNLFNSVTMRP